MSNTSNSEDMIGEDNKSLLEEEVEAMPFNVAGSSTSVPVIPSSDLPTVEEVWGFNAEELNGFLKRRLNNINSHIDTLTAQKVDGEAFLILTHEGLKVYGIPLGPAIEIVELINDIQG
ncbi:15473_t:CDS:2, partial [Acaulospora morrowiae]